VKPLTNYHTPEWLAEISGQKPRILRQTGFESRVQLGSHEFLYLALPNGKGKLYKLEKEGEKTSLQVLADAEKKYLDTLTTMQDIRQAVDEYHRNMPILLKRWNGLGVFRSGESYFEANISQIEEGRENPDIKKLNLKDPANYRTEATLEERLRIMDVGSLLPPNATSYTDDYALLRMMGIEESKNTHLDKRIRIALTAKPELVAYDYKALAVKVGEVEQSGKYKLKLKDGDLRLHSGFEKLTEHDFIDLAVKPNMVAKDPLTAIAYEIRDEDIKGAYRIDSLVEHLRELLRAYRAEYSPKKKGPATNGELGMLHRLLTREIKGQAPSKNKKDILVMYYFGSAFHQYHQDKLYGVTGLVNPEDIMNVVRLDIVEYSPEQGVYETKLPLRPSTAKIMLGRIAGFFDPDANKALETIEGIKVDQEIRLEETKVSSHTLPKEAAPTPKETKNVMEGTLSKWTEGELQAYRKSLDDYARLVEEGRKIHQTQNPGEKKLEPDKAVILASQAIDQGAPPAQTDAEIDPLAGLLDN